MSPIEIIAVVFGLLSVWFTTRQSIWCWPTGLVQVVLFLFVFWEAKLYSDVILHAIYVVLQLYGWIHWKYGGVNRTDLPVIRLHPLVAIEWGVEIIVYTLAWGYGMARFTDAALPYWDAGIAVPSLFAQYLMTHKYVENWVLWMAVDVVAVGVYTAKGLYFTAGLYAVFLVLCVFGLVSWMKSMQRAVG